ncbi:TNF receptor-associated factor 1-like [Saccoglossus kowalevskii]
MATYNGTFIWKIDKVASKCYNARSILRSPQFHTSHNGYKMCVLLELNDENNRQNATMSLYFTLMKGTCDANLEWPFKHKVTFMLLNQNEDDHIADTFQPNLTSATFQRPVSEMNIATGCPSFTNLMLQLGDVRYIQNDEMFLKIIVDISDLTE